MASSIIHHPSRVRVGSDRSRPDHRRQCQPWHLDDIHIALFPLTPCLASHSNSGAPSFHSHAPTAAKQAAPSPSSRRTFVPHPVTTDMRHYRSSALSRSHALRGCCKVCPQYRVCGTSISRIGRRCGGRRRRGVEWRARMGMRLGVEKDLFLGDSSTYARPRNKQNRRGMQSLPSFQRLNTHCGASLSMDIALASFVCSK